jgi:outer membrane protein assembly factor BamB
MRRVLCCVLLFLATAVAAQTTYQPSWQYNATSSVVFEPTLGNDGSVYFATADAKLRALNAKGIQVWKVDPGGQIITPIALQNGVLYFANSSQQIRAYSVAGKMIWKAKVGINAATPLAVSPDLQIFFGAADGDLYCVDGSTSQVKWHLHLGFVIGPPTVGHDGTVYVASENFVNAVNPANGHVIWRRNFFNFSSVPIVMDQYDDLFYNRKGILDVYDMNGNFLWEARDDKGALLLIQEVPPVIYGDMLIAAVQGGGDVYAFDVSTGTILWEFNDVNSDWSPSVPHSMAIDRFGTVSYCDSTGVIAWFDGVTGAFYGYMPSVGNGRDVNLVGDGSNGFIVIRSGTDASELVSYKVPAGPAPGPWSQAGMSARHLQRRDDAPYIDMAAPPDGSIVTGAFNVTLNATDDFSLSKVELYLNDTEVASSKTSYLSWTANSAVFQNGNYTLTAIAYDSAGNQGTRSISLQFSNPVPVYALSSGSPVFTWLSNGIDNKYQVLISMDPSFSSVVLTSKTQRKKWVKGTSWQPSLKKWRKKVITAASQNPATQVTFYWRVVGKKGGLVLDNSFIFDKSK